MHLLPLYMAPCTNRHPHLETLQATTYTLENLRADPVFKSNSTEKVQPRRICSIQWKTNTTPAAWGIHCMIKWYQPQVVVLMTAAYRTAFCLLFNCLDSTRLLYSTRGIFYFCSTAAVCKPNQCSSLPSHGSFSMHTGGGLSKQSLTRRPNGKSHW